MKYDNLKFNRAEKFTAAEHAILESFFPVVDALGNLLGETCEVVLHSLEDTEKSVVKFVNGHISGRQMGAPITDLSLHMLNKMHENGANFADSYFTRAKNGKLMKCTTVAIRNLKGEAIALLCINLNLDSPMSNFIAALTPSHLNKITGEQGVTFNEENSLEAQLERISDEIIKDHNIAAKEKVRQIIYRLYRDDLFELKGAVNTVSTFLDISRHTVYLYIREYRKKHTTLDFTKQK
ncbi:hypothetical protein SIN8267_03511 [Sinobacterium norvegicum]|uniref:Uncharacterized protein n=1 Tax=Sinobacterium norvegicum TaxID=1641715 RepID=A0ABM9AJP6_9GAMM|nr:PAS domain-containing protein [Sinobacterium norvegicum]CAH0993363.1 hypothetical protein SIN8267_03511 [Sinobacterium norvegicum]